MSSNPITVPSGYATAFAIGFADAASGNLSIVDSGRPLPVSPVRAAAAAPLTGSTAASGTFGPFTPIAQRPVFITLGGTWQGTVSLRRSLDGGQTLLRRSGLGHLQLQCLRAALGRARRRGHVVPRRHADQRHSELPPLAVMPTCVERDSSQVGQACTAPERSKLLMRQHHCSLV